MSLSDQARRVLDSDDYRHGKILDYERISKICGVSKSRVSDIAAELVQSGWAVRRKAGRDAVKLKPSEPVGMWLRRRWRPPQ
jgi:predicted transcriptional regulator